jgi:hypothetical protein
VTRAPRCAVAVALFELSGLALYSSHDLYTSLYALISLDEAHVCYQLRDALR